MEGISIHFVLRFADDGTLPPEFEREIHKILPNVTLRTNYLTNQRTCRTNSKCCRCGYARVRLGTVGVKRRKLLCGCELVGEVVCV